MSTTCQRLAIVATVGLGCGLAGCADASAGRRVRMIRVYGEGKAQAAPDRFELRVSVSHRHEDLEVAMSQVTQASQAVLAAVGDYPTDRDRTRTTDFDIDREYNRDGEFLGYDVDHYLTLVLTDPSQADRFTVAMLKAGVTTIRSADYEYSEKDSLYAQAAELALLDARAKAERMAAVLGQRLGDPLGIGGAPHGHYYDYDAPPIFSDGDSSDAEADFYSSPTEVVVEQELPVYFELVRP